MLRNFCACSLSLLAIAVSVGCGGGSDGGGVSGATVQSMPKIARTMAVHDARGDTKARDLDILSARVSFDATVDSIAVSLRLARAPRDNVYYTAAFTCGENYRQLAFKRAAGEEFHILYDLISGTNSYDADGEVLGRILTMSASASGLGCATAESFHVALSAEGTNGRPPETDDAPPTGRVFVFPSGKVIKG